MSTIGVPLARSAIFEQMPVLLLRTTHFLSFWCCTGKILLVFDYCENIQDVICRTHCSSNAAAYKRTCSKLHCNCRTSAHHPHRNSDSSMHNPFQGKLEQQGSINNDIRIRLESCISTIESIPIAENQKWRYAQTISFYWVTDSTNQQNLGRSFFSR